MLGPIFVIVGLGMFVIWLLLRKKANAANAWPSTPGKIVASQIQRSRDTDGEYAEVLVVAYDYNVGGALRGTRVSFSGSGSGSSKQKLARYPAGKEVEVFYDPKNPSSAVLERKLPGSVLVLPIVGTFFVVMGFVAQVVLR